MNPDPIGRPGRGLRQDSLTGTVVETTRTVDGKKQFCRGAYEHGVPTHSVTTYTTIHYPPLYAGGPERRFHFCDDHPFDRPKGFTPEGGAE